MAYTPINWQTGDTITAEKLNKMDNGWSMSSTQLFSETVTTEGEELAEAILSYSTFIDASYIIVTFDDTDYLCPRINAGGDSIYGGFNNDEPDFSTIPFYIYSSSVGDGNQLITETAGTYTVVVKTANIEVSDSFYAACNRCVDASTMPFLCVNGVTTAGEISNAIFNTKRLCYFEVPEMNAFYFINQAQFTTDYDAIISFYPQSADVNASITNGIFTVSMN